MVSKCCRWWCGCSCIWLRFDNRWNPQFGHPVLHISLTEVVRCFPQSRLGQFIMLHLPLPKSLPALVYRFGGCSHYPAGFAIFHQVAQLCILCIISVVFPILLIVRTWKIAQTVSHRIQHLLKWFFRLSGRRSRFYSISHIFLLFHNCCLCVLNLLSCHSGHSVHKILDPFLVLLFAQKLRFSSILCWMLLFRLQAALCSKCWDPICLQATLAFSGFMRSSCGQLGRFAVYARRKWRNVHSQTSTIVSWLDFVGGQDVGCCKT